MSIHETGLKRMREILGERTDEIVKKFEKISPDFSNYIVDFAYGDIYTRPTLSDKLKEFAAVASLMGQGNLGMPLRSHLNGMLNVGWTKEEIIELIIFLMCYVGFPTAVDVLVLAQEVFESRAK